MKIKQEISSKIHLQEVKRHMNNPPIKMMKDDRVVVKTELKNHRKNWQKIQKDPENIQQKYLQVEKILDLKTYYGYVQYLVKWVGYDVSEATWEPVRNVKHCKDLLDEFHVAHPEAAQPISLTNPRPVQRQFNRHVWLERFAGAQVLKRG